MSEGNYNEKKGNIFLLRRGLTKQSKLHNASSANWLMNNWGELAETFPISEWRGDEDEAVVDTLMTIVEEELKHNSFDDTDKFVVNYTEGPPEVFNVLSVEINMDDVKSDFSNLPTLINEHVTALPYKSTTGYADFIIAFMPHKTPTGDVCRYTVLAKVVDSHDT